MLKTVDFIDNLRHAYRLTSDYQVAQKLGVKTSQVSAWRNGKEFFGEKTATRLAEMLELKPAYVYSCAQLERTKTEEARLIWEEFFNKIKPSPEEEERLMERWPGCILCSIPLAYSRASAKGTRALVSQSLTWAFPVHAPASRSPT